MPKDFDRVLTKVKIL